MSLVVLILHTTIQQTAWLIGSTNTYYLEVKGFETPVHLYNCFFFPYLISAYKFFPLYPL